MSQIKTSEVLRTCVRSSLADRGVSDARLGSAARVGARVHAIRADNVIARLGGPGVALEKVVARKARFQEKEELSTLNDRFASYIKKMRQLQEHNSKLEAQVLKLEVQSKEVTNKEIYEKEIGDLRALVDELAEDKARVVLDRDRWREETAEYKGKWQDEAAWHDQLNSEVGKLNKDLYAATLVRVDLQKKVAALQDEINFMVVIHKEETKKLHEQLNQSLSILKVEQTSETGPGIIVEQLCDLRQQYEDFCRDIREEAEANYRDKFNELQQQRERDNKAMLAARSELISSRQEVTELRKQLSSVMTTMENVQSQSSTTYTVEEVLVTSETGEMSVVQQTTTQSGMGLLQQSTTQSGMSLLQ